MNQRDETMPDQEWADGFVWGFLSTFDSITKQELVDKAADKLVEMGSMEDVEDARSVVREGIENLEEKGEIQISESGHVTV